MSEDRNKHSEASKRTGGYSIGGKVVDGKRVPTPAIGQDVPKSVLDRILGK
jgi:hypothetical protein